MSQRSLVEECRNLIEESKNHIAAVERAFDRKVFDIKLRMSDLVRSLGTKSKDKMDEIETNYNAALEQVTALRDKEIQQAQGCLKVELQENQRQREALLSG